MYEDEPQDKVHDIFTRAVFGGHTLGRPVIGTADVVSGLSRKQVAAYHDSRYLPENIVVAAAGNIDHETLTGLVAGVWSEARSGDGFVRRLPDAPAAASPRALFHRKDTDQYHLCIGGLGIPRSDERRFALAVLDSIFGGSMSSRLFQEVREKRGLAYAIYSFTSQYQETGFLGVYVGTRAENVPEAMKVIAEELHKLCENPASEAELKRAKEHFKGRLVLSMESSATRMSRLGSSVIGDVEILTLDETIAKIDAVTVDALRELVESFYRPEAMSAAGIGPEADRFHDALEPVSGRLADELATVS